MPEDLPTPKKSLKQLEKENKKALKKREFEMCRLIGIFHKYKSMKLKLHKS